MGKVITKINVAGEPNSINLFGSQALKISFAKEGDFSFFRRKVSGNLTFAKGAFSKIADGCCNKIAVSVFRECSGEERPEIGFFVNTRSLSWNFETCEAETSKLDLEDIYTQIFKVWEKKVNMCAVERNATMKHWYRKVTQETASDGSLVDNFSYPDVTNNNGVYFNDWLMFGLTSGLGSLGIVPSTISELSTFFSAEINPCTGKANDFLNAVVFQITDCIVPDETRIATGINEDGTLNEDVALSPKYLITELCKLFSLFWYVDSATGKLRIEHTSFKENGYSYTAPWVDVDLSQAKYAKNLKSFFGNFKYADSELPGVEELILTPNQSIFNSEKSLVIRPYSYSEFYKGEFDYKIPKIDDFHLGNIKYDSDCVKIQENGEVLKNSITSDLFYTYAHGIFIIDDNVNENGWSLFLLDEEGNVKKGTCERTVQVQVPNADFSASSIFRKYHRWERPFAFGLMNYSDTPNGLIGAGIKRKMQSISYDKEFQDVEIDFCCGDSIDLRRLVKLKSGELCKVDKAEVDLYKDKIKLSLLGLPACGITNVGFPTGQEGGESTECLPYGTLLGSEEISRSCYAYAYVGTDRGCVGFDSVVTGTRYIYSDGECGSYVVEIMDDCPQNDPECL